MQGQFSLFWSIVLGRRRNPEFLPLIEQGKILSDKVDHIASTGANFIDIHDIPGAKALIKDALRLPRVSFCLRSILDQIPEIDVSYTRLVDPVDVPCPDWHQDRQFLKNDRAWTLWIALDSCGLYAPSIQFAPLDHAETNTLYEHRERTHVVNGSRVFPSDLAEAIFQGRSPIRPQFEPGDAVFFDENCLHSTFNSGTMRTRRLSVDIRLAR
jgi:hypothetical protein